MKKLFNRISKLLSKSETFTEIEGYTNPLTVEEKEFILAYMNNPESGERGDNLSTYVKEHFSRRGNAHVGPRDGNCRNILRIIDSIKHQEVNTGKYKMLLLKQIEEDTLGKALHGGFVWRGGEILTKADYERYQGKELGFEWENPDTVDVA